MAMKKSWREIWLALFLYFLLTLLLTSPLLFFAGSKVRDYGDSLLNTWILTTVAGKLARLEFKDFFSANIFYPEERPLLYSELLIPQALLAWPIIKISGNPVLAHNLILLLALLTSAMGLFLLARYLSQQFWPSLLAGVIFAFSPFMMAHTFQIQVLSAGGLPLTFLFLHRYFSFRMWADWLAFTLVFIIQSLANIYYALFLIIFSGLFIFIGALTRRTYRQKAFWLHLFVFICLFIIFLGPIFLAYARQQAKTGFERTIGAEATITSFLVTPRTNWLYGEWSSRFRRAEQELFPGFIPLFLTLVSLIFASIKIFVPSVLKKRTNFQPEGEIPRISKIWKEDFSSVTIESQEEVSSAKRFPSSRAKLVFFYFFFLMWGVLFSLGSKGPFYFFHRFIPGYRAIRAVTRFHIFTMLALSILAAFGTIQLLDRIKKKNLRALLIFSILVLIILEYISIPLPLRPVSSRQELAGVYQELSRWPEKKVILELPLPERRSGIGRVEGLRMYYSLFHGHRLVNGYSGFFSPVYLQIREKLNQQSLEENLIFWRDLGIDLIIIHCEEIDLEDCPNIIDYLKKSPDLIFRGQFDHDFLFSMK